MAERRVRPWIESSIQANPYGFAFLFISRVGSSLTGSEYNRVVLP
jgi:hypothetical protein